MAEPRPGAVVRLPTAAPRKVRQPGLGRPEALAGVTPVCPLRPATSPAGTETLADAMAASAPLLIVGLMLPFCSADALASIHALAVEHHRLRPTAETGTAVRLLECALSARPRRP